MKSPPGDFYLVNGFMQQNKTKAVKGPGSWWCPKVPGTTPKPQKSGLRIDSLVMIQSSGVESFVAGFVNVANSFLGGTQKEKT